jgi:hypothetical protein
MADNIVYEQQQQWLHFQNVWFCCTKGLLVRIRSSLLVMILRKCTKHYNYLQAYLH